MPVTSDIEVTPPVETNVSALASIETCIHIDEGFLGESNDFFVLTRYADLVAFRLWQGDVCIYYVELNFIYC